METDKTRAMSADELAARQVKPAAGVGVPTHAGAASEATQAMPAHGAAASAPAAHVDAETLLSDVERRRKIEQDLSRLGMSPVEIRRLLEADANSADPLKQTPKQPPKLAAVQMPVAPPPPTAIRPTKGKAGRATIESMANFAAQLQNNQATTQVRAVEQAALELPEFRTSTAQETLQAESLMRDAAMLRRREKYGEAEQKCRQALQLVPKDAAALEFLGDLLQGVAKIDEALAAYKRAVEADSRRSSAERKYGDLLMRQQRWSAVDPEAVPKNPLFAILLSLLFPGLGQLHNGDTGKGIFFLLVDVVCIYLLAFSPWGFAGGRHGLSTALIGSCIFTVVVYVASAIDANMIARQGGPKRGGSSGWDV
jgi:tetratricopeptide (TPR) repeat protein